MVMEEMKLVDVHHTQLIKNFTIVKGTIDVFLFKDKSVCVHFIVDRQHTIFSQQVLLDRQGPKGTVVRPAQKDQWDWLGVKVTEARQEAVVLLERRVLLGLKEHQVKQVPVEIEGL